MKWFYTWAFYPVEVLDWNLIFLEFALLSEFPITCIFQLFSSLTVVPPYRETIFWPSHRPKEADPFRTRTLGTHSTAFRATCTRYFNNFMAHYLYKIARSVSRHPIMRFSFCKRLSISFLIITRIYLKSIISITGFSDFFLVWEKW